LEFFHENVQYHIGFQDKVRKGELEDKIATGGFGCWRDENPNAVF
jgi:hypothetical protein